MVRAVQIGRENLDDDLDDIVRALLIRSMAGIIVARLGVSQGKYSIL